MLNLDKLSSTGGSFRILYFKVIKAGRKSRYVEIQTVLFHHDQFTHRVEDSHSFPFELIVNGKVKGVHAFMLRVRDASTHELLPGIQAGDIGPKLG